VPNDYGVSTTQLNAVHTGGTTLNTDLTAVTNAKAQYHATVQAKDAEQKVLVNSIAALAKTVYANPAVTDAMIAALGLAPRKSPSKNTPVQPLSLTATPNADGTVKLKWNRNGNASTIIFVIETSADGSHWDLVKATNRTSYTAFGFDPGVLAWFRVTATTSTASSAPSTAVAIYGPAAPSVPQLKVA